MNEKNTSSPSQMTLMLRFLCGGYLLYLAYGLRNALHDGPVYIAAAVIFAAVGAGLVYHALRRVIQGNPEDNEKEDSVHESI